MEKVLIELLKSTRNQRHDFLNHLQVIWGYLQINKSDLAVEYIREVVDYLHSLRCLNNIEAPQLAAVISARIIEVGLQKNFTVHIPELWQIPQEKIANVTLLIKEIWESIKPIIFEGKTAVKISLVPDQIKITLNNNEKHNCNWDNLIDIVNKRELEYHLEAKQISINI